MTHTPIKLLAVSIAFTLFIGAGSALARQAPDSDLQLEIEEGSKQFMAAFNRGDAAALAAMYTEEGWIFPPNSDIVSGQEAIQKFWQGAMDSGLKGLKLSPLEMQGAGDTAYEVGRFTLTGEGGKVIDTGKYIIIFKQERGGWKLHRDIWNTSKPAPGK